jgi:hypothetical protein
MPSEFELRGAVSLARVAKALQAEADAGKGFRKELQSELVRGTKGARKDMKAAIPGALPKSGGLAGTVAGSSSFVVATSKSRSVGGNVVGVRIQGKRRGLKGRSLARLNAGTVNHPVFGNRDVWVNGQTAGITKGFLDSAFQKQAPEVKAAVIKAINNTKNRIYRSV